MLTRADFAQLPADKLLMASEHGLGPAGQVLSLGERCAAQAELHAQQIERGRRLPDDARCEACRWWRAFGKPNARMGRCHIRSTSGPFPERYHAAFCGEWARKPT